MDWSPAPNDIFNIARRNNIVKSYINLWLSGDMSWEEALTSMVIELEAVITSGEFMAILPQTKTYTRQGGH